MSKMIKVDETTHSEVKKNAKKKGMTMQGYIKYLIKLDNSQISYRRQL